MTWNLKDMDLFDGNGSERIEWQWNAEREIAATIRDVSPDILFVAEAPSLIELQQFVRANQLGYQGVSSSAAGREPRFRRFDGVVEPRSGVGR